VVQETACRAVQGCPMHQRIKVELVGSEEIYVQYKATTVLTERVLNKSLRDDFRFLASKGGNPVQERRKSKAARS